MYARDEVIDERAELAQLVGEQRADDDSDWPGAQPRSKRQWPEHRRSVSLDTEVLNEDGVVIGTVGTELIGYDPWDAIDDALDTGLEPPVSIDSTSVDSESGRFLPDYLRDQPWDHASLYVNGSRFAPPHPFRDQDAPQLAQAYGKRFRRRPNSSRVAPAILAKLFDCITTAVGADVAREAAGRRGRPSAADRRARMLAAVAVQTFREMGYTPRSIAAVLALPERTVQRYMDPELLPVLSPEAHARIFGGSLTAADSEPTSVPGSERDAMTAPRPRSAPASYDQLIPDSARSHA